MDIATASNSDYIYTSVGAGVNGPMTIENFLDMLLDLPMDAGYDISMQESKSFPLEMEGHHTLHVEGFGEIWRVAKSSRAQQPELTELQRRQKKEFPIGRMAEHRPFTVRGLIHKLMEYGFSHNDIVDIGGHFYTGFSLRVYPAAPVIVFRADPKDVVSVSKIDFTSSK